MPSLLLYAMLIQFTKGVGGGKAVWSWNRTGKQTLFVFPHRKPSERVCAQHISARWWAVEIGKEGFRLKIAVGSEKWSIVQKTCCWVGKNRSTTHTRTHKHTYRSAILTHQCTISETSWWPGSLDLSGLLAKHAILKHLPWHFRQSVESGKQERPNQRRMIKGHVGIFMTWAPQCGGRAIVTCITSIKTLYA